MKNYFYKFCSVSFLLLFSLSLKAQWQESSFGIKQSVVFCFGQCQSRMIVGTYGQGLYYSDNSGKSWNQYNTVDVQDDYISALVVNGSSVSVATASGLYVTGNCGTSWNYNVDGLTNSNIRCMIAVNNKLCAGTQSGGIFMMNGSTWYQSNSGLTNPNMLCLASLDNIVLAGTNGGGIFVSNDDGSSWTSSNSGLTSNIIYSIAVNDSNILAGTKGAGIFISQNGGTSWAQLDNDLKTYNVVSIATNGKFVFAGTEKHGIYFSNNYGQSWKPINSGLTDSSAYAFGIFGNTVYAGSEKRVFKANLSDFNVLTVQIKDQNPTNLCTGDTLRLIKPDVNGGIPPFKYSWKPTTGLNDSTWANPFFFPKLTTSYTLTVTDNSLPPISGQSIFKINLLPKPPKPNISLNADSLIVTGGKYYIFEWFKNGISVSQTNKPSLKNLTTGDYFLIATDTAGCRSDSSNHVQYNSSRINDFDLNTNFAIYPNPVENLITFSISFPNPSDISIEIFNNLGIQVIKRNYQALETDNIQINTEVLPSNFYYYVIKSKNTTLKTGEFIILR
ncbi:MAG: T9SS type A sorting domain-containing protein [Candidatus Kapabacteria bacterium]|nr:T9SS type A sorting domain-containing protein [Candidatus Kapabacteria bacterium]